MRYFIGFLITIGLIILLIVLIFGGGGSKKSTLPTSNKSLDSYAGSDAEVRMTIDGPVNADQIHRQIQIDVSKDQITYEQITGYQGGVTKTTNYENNQSAYSDFLRTLAVAGFTKGNTDPQLKDERGYCPLGDRYIFEFIQEDKVIERYWATGCGGVKSFLGDLDITTQLFEAQVPDFNEVNLGTELS